MLLTQEKVQGEVAQERGQEVVCMDGGVERRARQREESRRRMPESGAGAGESGVCDLYVGIDGEPKGVGIEHRRLWMHLAAVQESYGLGKETDAGRRLCHCSFDVSVYGDCSGPLSGGSAV